MAEERVVSNAEAAAEQLSGVSYEAYPAVAAPVYASLAVADAIDRLTVAVQEATTQLKDAASSLNGISGAMP